MEKYYKLIINNKKAFFNYNITERIKCGIVLEGSEVKSIRLGKANFKDAFARVDNQELWLYNMHVGAYGASRQSTVDSRQQDRKRKLLVTGNELRKIISKTMEKGMVAVPTKLFLDGNWVKVEIGLGKAKHRFEKKETLKRKSAQRDIERALREKKK